MEITLAVSALLLVVASAHPPVNPYTSPVLDPEAEEYPVLVFNPTEADPVYELQPSLLQELLWRQYSDPDVALDETVEPPQDPQENEQELDETEQPSQDPRAYGVDSGHERKKRQTSVSTSVNTERRGT